MKKVIFDCDNTMGLPGRDVDDGLSLFYLLGSPEIELLGVCSTFGNDCDAQASYTFFQSGSPITCLTGNMCLHLPFTKKYSHLLSRPSAIFSYLQNQCDQWFTQFSSDYNNEGVIIWDLVAAMYCSHPQLFECQDCFISPSIRDLKEGFLRITTTGTPLNLPSRCLNSDLFLI